MKSFSEILIIKILSPETQSYIEVYNLYYVNYYRKRDEGYCPHLRTL